MGSSTLRASASLPSAPPGWKYDVFVSFRGEDSRRSFVSHLYHELQRRGIKTFTDDLDLEVGESISPILLKAIEESRFAIIVLSRNYASSSWCLEELTKIVDCMEDENRIHPLFYHVEPSDVRHQKMSFEIAFNEHDQKSRVEIEKLKKWRDALKTVANFSGWHTQNYKTERELIEGIVKSVCNKVLPVKIESTMTEFMDETSPPGWKYDVFVSFRGTDSRRSLPSYLYHELQRRGIKTFMDDLELEVGAFISPTLLKAIKESRFAIIVLSPNYATSSLCLEELKKIVDFMEDENRILPVFYYVEPKKSFERAFTEHEKRHDRETVKQWRDALEKVANFPGWHTQNYKTEIALVEAIVESVCNKLPVKIESTMTEFIDETLPLPREKASSSSAARGKPDVFFSFRVEDIHQSFISYLYNELHKRGIEILNDYQGHKTGTTIAPTLLEAIKESSFAIVILSPKYASSACCLEELTKIFQYKDKDTILPIFYHVEPSDVRHQRNSFEVAFTEHEEWSRNQYCGTSVSMFFRQNMEKVKQWRVALKMVANLSGWVSEDYRSERELIKYFVQYLCSKVLPIEVEPPEPQWKHDVYLSFRGVETGEGLVSHLYHRLQNRGIKTFMDDQGLVIGAPISPSLLMAIQESRFAIVVLSQDYASSPWCLDELTNIVQCMEDHDRILPLFYDVEPSDVRKQRGSFEVAFSEHESRQDAEKVKQWRTALEKVANLSSWDSKYHESDRELVEDIVEFVCSKVLPIAIESTTSTKDFEATRHAMDQTMASRSRRPYAFLPSAPWWKHDVFLSTVRDEDIHQGFISLLHSELQERGIKMFKDIPDENEMHISPNIQTAIKDSRFAVVVLSPNYASSTRCLDELTKSIEAKNTTTIPIFYHVDSSNVRHKKRSFEVAFTKHDKECRQDIKKVEQWRDALRKVADLSGWDSINFKNDSELVKDIVEFLFSKLVLPNEVESWIKDVEATRQAMDRTSEPTPRWKHDVFLSFRGEDTRANILSHLYHELKSTRGINTFKDDQDLVVGTPISPNLIMAIQESRLAVVVLSQQYASSTWCLDELLKIFECMEDKDAIVPIFYNVDPSDVRKQKGSFETAFITHANSGDKKKVQQWRDALEKVAKISGFHSNNFKDERELVEKIGKVVWSKVLQVRIEIESIISIGGFEEFKATEQAMEEVMKALEDDKVNIIGVYGKGGVGKTTMVRHVSAKAQNRLFDHVIMVVVSQNPDLRKIQGIFADMLGLNFQDETKTERTIRLKERIMGGNRILIILDNIRKSIDLSNLGIPSSKELQKCNSKVLLTTRKSNLCQAMGSQKEINLTTLSEEDSWKLFMKKSGKNLESKDLNDVARKVAKQCVGLPIALIAVAKALRDKVDLEEWKEASRQLEISQTAGLDDGGDGFNCIKLSYDYLRGEYVKSCFLLCCLFPEDEDIQIENLMEYGYGKGLFQHTHTVQEARATTHMAVMYLKACGLLLDGTEDGCVRMHDVIRSMAMLTLYEDGRGILAKAACELKDWPMDANRGCSAISLMKNKIRNLPKELVCSKLEMLLLQGNADINHIPNTFFQYPNAIRVLDLSDTKIMSLPQSFSLLINLRTLYLDGCKSLTDVSRLKNVTSLQILSMREFPLEALPKEIGHLSHLRILDVTSGCIDAVPSKVMSELHRLEELYMQCNFVDWGSNVEGAGEETNAVFDELIDLPYLNTLKVGICDVKCLPKNVRFHPYWVSFDICISRDSGIRESTGKAHLSHDHSRSLTLSTTVNTLPDWFIIVVTEKAEKLEYYECKELNNIIVEFDHGRLHGLKYLAITGPHANLEELLNTTTRVPIEPLFVNLEELHLHCVDHLKKFCVGELPPRSLCNLKILAVSECKNLKSLFTSVVAQCLLKLEDLSITRCNTLDSVIEASEETMKQKIIFPELKNLVLLNLPKLTWFCSTGSVIIECPSLERLHMLDCPQFSTSTSDFHTWKRVEVSDLRHLSIERHTEYMVESLSPNLRQPVEKTGASIIQSNGLFLGVKKSKIIKDVSRVEKLI